MVLDIRIVFINNLGGGMQKQSLIKFRQTGRVFVAVMALAPLCGFSPGVVAAADLGSHHDRNIATTRVSVATDGSQAANGAEFEHSASRKR